MTEQEFWSFLKKLWEKGRASQLTATFGGNGSQAQAYIGGHTFLPKEYDNFTGEDIIRIGSLLFKKGTSRKCKEAVMVLLAHQPSEVALTILTRYSLVPDKGLEFFAKMALEECAMWNE
jgi:hypothetical protein